jgi:DNA polymerase-3 subunit gamma/tau
MSYQVLARKWRPHTLQDMVGQEPIRRMLSNALLQNRIHHAYLFTGTRGVGKTTLARILAKCLNCESGITPTPCDTCSICKAIDAGQFLDLYEIDAASRTKVEDTRELLDNVPYPPTQGRYKIYLIDEVHMLSNHSFNALLKTLEEPPAHVKFLLATTDPKRLPITILSRCLQFHLTRISLEQITLHLQHICTEEKIQYEQTALEKLAQAADGSLRDAISLLDQAIAYGQGKIQLNDIHVMLGTLNQNNLIPLLHELAAKNNQHVFNWMTQLAEHAPDFSHLLDELSALFHQIALAQMIPEIKTTDESIKTLATAFTPEIVQHYYQMILAGKRDLAYASTPQQGFEMILLRMLADTSDRVYTQPVTGSTPSTTSDQEQHAPVPLPSKKEEPLLAWRDILPQLGLSGMAYALAANCVLKKMHDNKIELTLSAHHQPMLNPKLHNRIAEALSRHFKQTIQLEIITTTNELLTPVKQQQQEQEARLLKATQTMLEHPQVKQLIEMYDATLEVSTR